MCLTSERLTSRYRGEALLICVWDSVRLLHLEVCIFPRISEVSSCYFVQSLVYVSTLFLHWFQNANICSSKLLTFLVTYNEEESKLSSKFQIFKECFKLFLLSISILTNYKHTKKK